MIPDLLGMIFKVDIIEMAVSASMGNPICVKVSSGMSFYATHNLHTDRNGILKNIIFSEKIKPNIIRVCTYKKSGDIVEYFDNAAKVLGIVFFRFSSEKEMFEILRNINDYILIEVKEA